MDNLTNQDNTKDKYQTKSNKNTINLRNWTGVWLISLAITAFGPKYFWDFNAALSTIAILVNLAAGFGMLISNKRYLNDLDEMQQKILLNAMAFTLGIGLVLGTGYEQLEDMRLISFEPEISHLFIIMVISYLSAVISGHRKYQ